MNEIDEIRWQMAQIRHDLHQDVSSVVTSVSEVVSDVSGVMDWRSGLRKHPYFITSGALLAGYFLVPRRKAVAAAVGSQPERLLSGPVVAETPRKARFRPLSWAINMAWPIATQALQSYAMIWVENQLKQQLQSASPDFSRTPSGERRSELDSDDRRFNMPGSYR